MRNGYKLQLLPTSEGYIVNNGGDETGTEFVFAEDADGTVSMSIPGGAYRVRKLATAQ